MFPAAMGIEGWYTLAVLAAMVLALSRDLAGPDLVSLGGLFALAAPGLLTPAEAFQGFASPALAAIAALFVVSAALRETGLLETLVERLLRGAVSPRSALVRICPPLAAASAFLNNAPIVAMMTPVVIDWSRRRGLPAGKFLIPLSYATVLGSVLTVIGTSVNLMVAGLMTQNGLAPMGFFELLPVGMPIALVGLAYITLAAPRLIPVRREAAEELGEQRREYTCALRVQPHCPLVGLSVEQAELRRLPGLFLVEIDRQGQTITPARPEQRIAAGDALVFAGIVETIVDLQRIPGLAPIVADDAEAESKADRRRSRRLMEAVVSSASPLVGRSIRGANFRTAYDAAVLAVHRGGERVGGKIGEIVLRQGDTLLLQTAPGFRRVHRNSNHFYLVSEIEGSEAPRPEKALPAVLILCAMVAAAALGILPISIAAFLAAGLLLITGVIDAATARASVAWSVLIVIGAGFGIAAAMQKTGAAAFIAEWLALAGGKFGPLGALALVYAAAVVLSEVLHHNASAAIMLPIALACAGEVGAEPRSFALTVAVGATCAFANPVTYQAHLIVYGPGGYRFLDFVRVGLPLNLLTGAVALTMIPLVYDL